MRWYYKIIEKTPAYYRYAYSRESKDYDGVIIYYIATGEAIVEKPCIGDAESKAKMESAIAHFWYVVDDAFPEERSVCCG